MSTDELHHLTVTMHDQLPINIATYGSKNTADRNCSVLKEQYPHYELPLASIQVQEDEPIVHLRDINPELYKGMLTAIVFSQPSEPKKIKVSHLTLVKG